MPHTTGEHKYQLLLLLAHKNNKKNESARIGSQENVFSHLFHVHIIRSRRITVHGVGCPRFVYFVI